MFTPVGDYMLPVKKDFADLLVYLKSYYAKDISNEKELSLKKVHKMIWVIMIWKNSQKEDNTYFNDMILNLLSIIHNCVLGDAKVINFLTRNIIEDFIKYCKKYFKINDKDLPRNIFPIIFQSCIDEKFIHDNFKVIKFVYDESSKLIHSSTVKNENVCICLREYNLFYSDEQIDNCILNLDKICRAINNIICLKEKSDFMHMNISFQSILRDYMNKEDLNRIES